MYESEFTVEHNSSIFTLKSENTLTIFISYIASIVYIRINKSSLSFIISRQEFSAMVNKDKCKRTWIVLKAEKPIEKVGRRPSLPFMAQAIEKRE